MKVSIVIPVYNVTAFIERSLNSALNQSYRNIEIILVDDASPDSSIDTAKRLLKDHPGKDLVRFVSHPVNKGLGAARNTGVRASSGDYVFFLDSDDEISNDCIEILINFTQGSDLDLIAGEIKVIGNKRNAYPLLLLKEGIYRGNKRILDLFLRKKWYEMAWNKLIKRTLFTEKQLWFNEKILHEDTLWSFQMSLVIQSLGIVPKETYFYHIQGNSITQKKSARNIESFYYVIK
ncbi:MAG: glycosyltransferase, partial [Bacteroidales bacterium]|nr:glycosyltransferase [Bacteroidales bacterium]